MGVGEFSIAAATAVVGYDLAQDTIWQAQGKPRFLTGLALAGSAAALDTKIRLMVDTVEIGEFFNKATGAALVDAHMVALDGNYVPPYSQIHMYVEDAPATNPLNGILKWRG